MKNFYLKPTLELLIPLCLVLFSTNGFTQVEKQNNDDTDVSSSGFVFPCNCDQFEYSFFENIYGTTPLVTFYKVDAGEMINVQSYIADVDKRKCLFPYEEDNPSSFFGEGPYRFRFEISNPLKAIFVYEGNEEAVVDVTFENEDIVNGFAKLDLILKINSNWDLTLIQYNILFEDLGIVVSPDVGTVSDGGSSENTTIGYADSGSGCPNQLNVISGTYGVWHPTELAGGPNSNPFKITIEVEGSLSDYFARLIQENFAPAIADFTMADVNDDWFLQTNLELVAEGLPQLVTSNDVAVYLFSDFVGGGFVVDPDDLFIDTYGFDFSKNKEVKEAFLNSNSQWIGYHIVQNYTCGTNPTPLKTHTLSVRFGPQGNDTQVKLD